jgi:hypothetical protein
MNKWEKRLTGSKSWASCFHYNEAVGLIFIGFRSCVEGHMGGATKIVEPICGASKGGV